MRKLHAAFINECQARGIEIITTNTWRSFDTQDALYAYGRTVPGRKKTNARPGQSPHTYLLEDGTPASIAFDIVPRVKRELVWGTTGVNGALWEYIGEIGKSVGLVWGGDWKFKDRPHFELPKSREMLKERFPGAW